MATQSMSYSIDCTFENFPLLSELWTFENPRPQPPSSDVSTDHPLWSPLWGHSRDAAEIMVLCGQWSLLRDMQYPRTDLYVIMLYVCHWLLTE